MASNKKKTHLEYIQELKFKEIELEPIEEYQTAKTKIKHRCLKHNIVWSIAPTNALKGKGCRLCLTEKIRSKLLKSQMVYEEELSKRFDGKIVLIGEYLGANTLCHYKCKVCNYEWESSPSNLNCSTGCPKCLERKGKRNRLIKDEEFKELVEKYNPTLIVLGEYKNSKTPVLMKCKECGHGWKTRPCHIISNDPSNRTGCGKCAFRRVGKLTRKSQNQFVKEVHEKFPSIEIVSEYINAKKHVKLKCSVCGSIWYSEPSNLFYSMGCKVCNQYSSNGERLIHLFLSKNEIVYESQKTFKDFHNSLTNRPLSYDFYLPSYNLLIEFQGRQHERPVEKFGGEEQFEVQKLHDKMKRDYAKAHGIDLLEIWYYDIKNIETILTEYLNLESVETAVSKQVTA